MTGISSAMARLREWARRLKTETVALWFCARHPRTPFVAKAHHLRIACPQGVHQPGAERFAALARRLDQHQVATQLQRRVELDGPQRLSPLRRLGLGRRDDHRLVVDVLEGLRGCGRVFAPTVVPILNGGSNLENVVADPDGVIG